MRRFNVAVIDGIPGIMPGVGSLLPIPPKYGEEETKSPQTYENNYVSKEPKAPKDNRRMMPCNRTEKKSE